MSNKKRKGIINLTVKEAKGDEERNGKDYRQMLDIDDLDGNKSSCGEHHCCDSKAGKLYQPATRTQEVITRDLTHRRW